MGSSRGVLMLTLTLAACATPPPPVVVKDIDFKAELRGAGEWIVVAPWGRVWHPHADVVGANFAPYVTGGGWVLGAEGWTFESPWRWGEYVFHYGRWFVADDLGWLWWPDQTRGNAWVQWRSGDGHTGWATLPPELKGARHQPPVWTWVKTRNLSAREVTPFVLERDDALRISEHAEPLPATGPNKEEVAAQLGLERDPPLPGVAPAPEPAPEPPPAEEPPPPPPPAKKKSKAKGKKRR